MRVILNICKFFKIWVIAVSCCLINLILDGIVRSSGLFFVAIQETFGVDRRLSSLPFTVCVAVRNLSGLLVGLLAEKYGPGSVSLLGGLVSSIGVAMCYFAKDVAWITASLGVVFGVGYGMGNILLPLIIGNSFKDSLSSATGLSFSGSCLGSLILPAILVYLLRTYGLQGTFLVTAGLVLNCVPLAMILIHAPTSKTREMLSCARKRSKSEVHGDCPDTNRGKMGNRRSPSKVPISRFPKPVRTVSVDMTGVGSASPFEKSRSLASSGSFLRTYSLDSCSFTALWAQHDSETSSAKEGTAVAMPDTSAKSSVSCDEGICLSIGSGDDRGMEQNHFESQNETPKNKNVVNEKKPCSVLVDSIPDPEDPCKSVKAKDMERSGSKGPPYWETGRSSPLRTLATANVIKESAADELPGNQTTPETKLNEIPSDRKEQSSLTTDLDIESAKTGEDENLKSDLIFVADDSEMQRSVASASKNEQLESAESSHSGNSKVNSTTFSKNSHLANVLPSITITEIDNNSEESQASDDNGIIYNSSSANEMTSASKPTPSAAELTSSATNSAPSASDTASSAKETTPSATNSNSTPSASETVPSAKKTTSSVTNSTSSATNSTPSAAELTSSATNSAPSASDTASSAKETRPSATNSNSTPSASETVPSAKETTSSVTNSTSSATNSTPSAAETKSSAAKTTPTALSKAAESKLLPKLKVTVIEYTISDEDELRQLEKEAKMRVRNNYRRHANSISHKCFENLNLDVSSGTNQKSCSYGGGQSPLCTSLSRTAIREEACPKRNPGNAEENHRRPDAKGIFRSLLVFKRPCFLAICSLMMCYEFIFVTTITVIVDYSKDLDVPEDNAKWILMSFSFGNVFSRLGLGWFTDSGLMKRNVFAAVCFAGIAFTQAGLSISSGFKTLMFFCTGYGVFESGAIVMFPLLLKQYMDENELTMAMASSNCGPGLITLLVPLAIGAFRDSAGSYDGLFYLMVASSLASSAVCLLLPCISNRKENRNFPSRYSVSV